MLCLGVVLLYKFYTLKSEGQGDIAPIAMGQLVKKVPKVWNSSNQPNIKRPISARQAKTDPTPKMGIKQKAEIKSNISKRRFAKQTFLKVPLPGHLKYIDVEIEEGVKSIYGYNYHSKEGLTAAARRGHSARSVRSAPARRWESPHAAGWRSSPRRCPGR